MIRWMLSKMERTAKASTYLAGGESCAMLVLCGVIATVRASSVKRPTAFIKGVALKGQPC